MKKPGKTFLLKLSGESLGGEKGSGIDFKFVRTLAGEIVEAQKQSGASLCIVTGGGNFMRGAQVAKAGIERASADYMGMLATVMNALALQNAIEHEGMPARVLSAIPMHVVCEPYIRRRALRHMEKGRIVICAAGTGDPYVTTDTAAALRAAELKCAMLLKATDVDGIYDSDPRENPSARRHARLTYEEVLARHLKIMDASAISLCRDNDIPIAILPVSEKGSLARALTGKGQHSLIASA